MSRARLIVLCAMLVLTVACSRSRKGAGDGTEDGAIPGAVAGGEFADVNFAFDSSALSESAQATLRSNAQRLNTTGKSVTVEGHCDERGTVEYNLALGERRARSVYDYLRSLGVKTEKLSTVSYGEELPLDPGHSESAWGKNRRAHFAAK